MTRRLLAHIGEARGSAAAILLASALALVLLPFVLVWDAAAWMRWRLRVARALAEAEARCPGGHGVELVGHWTCSSCKLTFYGHAWQDCPHGCGSTSRPHAIACACGRVVVNPLSPVHR